MTKISKEIKLRSLLEYQNNKEGISTAAKKFGISRGQFRMFVATFPKFRADVVLNPPQVTPALRVKIAR